MCVFVCSFCEENFSACRWNARAVCVGACLHISWECTLVLSFDIRAVGIVSGCSSKITCLWVPLSNSVMRESWDTWVSRN